MLASKQRFVGMPDSEQSLEKQVLMVLAISGAATAPIVMHWAMGNVAGPSLDTAGGVVRALASIVWPWALATLGGVAINMPLCGLLYLAIRWPKGKAKQTP